jgi:hypothetical protein
VKFHPDFKFALFGVADPPAKFHCHDGSGKAGAAARRERKRDAASGLRGGGAEDGMGA